MAFLEIDHLHKTFAGINAVHDFSLAVAQGEFVSFLGPSGCGKTTTLRMIAGFEHPDTGRIAIGGKDVTALRANQRKIGMVFQSYALFPNMTVAENIAYGLKIAKRPAAETRARVEEMLALIKLPALGGRYPAQLSGGQQQRVALARALSINPQVLLLDEPLSALDAKIRVSLRDEIRAVQRKLGITTIYVTHDQEEALSISDRIVVMREGRIDQVGAPFEIYNRPRTRFVASFVGTLNILQGRVIDGGSGRVAIDGQPVTIAESVGLNSGEIRSFALRPEAVSLANGEANGRAGCNLLRGVIEQVSFLGSVVRIRVKMNDNAVLLDTFNNPKATPPAFGQEVAVQFSPDDLMVLEGSGD
jgi:putative spermidine/putrescine transport system ATP-binding protein